MWCSNFDTGAALSNQNSLVLEALFKTAVVFLNQQRDIRARIARLGQIGIPEDPTSSASPLPSNEQGARDMAFLREISNRYFVAPDEHGRLRAQDPSLLIDNLLVGPPAPSDNPLDDIPVRDISYTCLSDEFIPHPMIPGVFSIRYLTFEGSMAYQPCSSVLNMTRLFETLGPRERAGEELFKTARVWSCMVQILPDLPKPVRWLLATIYQFANCCLAADVPEQRLMKLKPWLFYWYTVAEGLFIMFEVPVSTPDPIWFVYPFRVRGDGDTPDRYHPIWFAPYSHIDGPGRGYPRAPAPTPVETSPAPGEGDENESVPEYGISEEDNSTEEEDVSEPDEPASRDIPGADWNFRVVANGEFDILNYAEASPGEYDEEEYDEEYYEDDDDEYDGDESEDESTLVNVDDHGEDPDSE